MSRHRGGLTGPLERVHGRDVAVTQMIRPLVYAVSSKGEGQVKAIENRQGPANAALAAVAPPRLRSPRSEPVRRGGGLRAQLPSEGAPRRRRAKCVGFPLAAPVEHGVIEVLWVSY